MVTRPVPLLAETVVILAGASPLPWSRAVVAAVVGALPAAFLYAWAGAMAVRMVNGMVVFAVVLLLTSVLWWAARSRVG